MPGVDYEISLQIYYMFLFLMIYNNAHHGLNEPFRCKSKPNRINLKVRRLRWVSIYLNRPIQERIHFGYLNICYNLASNKIFPNWKKKEKNLWSEKVIHFFWLHSPPYSHTLLQDKYNMCISIGYFFHYFVFEV